MSDVAVVGCGLVSPLGLGVQRHVFYARASVRAVPAPAFETAEGTRIEAIHCGFLGATMAIETRLTRMASLAIGEALRPWEAAQRLGPLAVALVEPRRSGLVDVAAAAVRATIARRTRSTLMQTFVDAAGAFAALEQARAWLDSGLVEAALVVGVDSYIHPNVLADDLDMAPSDWCPRSPPAAEGAAALLLTRRDHARRLGLRMATVLGSGTAMGRGADGDDVIVDGTAMTSLLRAVATRPVDLVVGQEGVDDLRTRDWYIGRARAAGRFADPVEAVTLEKKTGRLGAASGVASLAFGVGALHHGIFRHLANSAFVLTWAISRNGLRGVALLQGGSA